MKKTKNLVILALMSLFTIGLTSCPDPKEEPLNSYKKVTADIFQKNIEASTKNGSPQIIDYRPYEEYAAGHIKYAINIPVTNSNAEETIKAELRTYNFDHNRNIYVYGSQKTNNTLGFYLAGIVSGEGWGMSKTFDLLGGIEAWIHAGYEIVKEE